MKSIFTKNLRKTILMAVFSTFGIAFLYSDTTHVVQKGETLYSISKKYNSTIQSICDANKIDGTGIKVGQKLVIPGIEEKKEAVKTEVKTAAKVEPKESKPAEKKENGNTESYTVKKGDTWYAVARLYSVNVKDLFTLNNADANSSLKAGQKIKVPATKTAPVVAKAQKTDTVLPVKVENAPIVDTHSYSTKKGDPNLVWPVERPVVTYVNGKVSGVSLSAKKDESVNAIKSGTVMFSGLYRGFGNVVFIQSKTGHIYAYTGLGKVLVSKGEYIDFKSQIGTAGIDSYSSKSQVSLMVFQNGLPIDPAKAPRG